MLDNSAQVEVVAAEALVEWKHLFATEVRKYAKKLAVESGQGELVTLKHYRQAAKIAISKLSDAIENSEPVTLLKNDDRAISRIDNSN